MTAVTMGAFVVVIGFGMYRGYSVEQIGQVLKYLWLPAGVYTTGRSVTKLADAKGGKK